MKEMKVSSKKRVIVLALITILLYFSCMVGATWALFTSPAKDGTIGINVTSGKLDVDLTDENGVSLLGQTLLFSTQSGKKEEVLFEPGATFYTQGFRVRNDGDIPMNYRLFVSEDKDLDMVAFYNAFEVWITTSPSQTAPAVLITEFDGKLLPYTNSEIYYLVIRMKTTANDDYQGEVYSGIGVTVYAVQGNYEM